MPCSSQFAVFLLKIVMGSLNLQYFVCLVFVVISVKF